MSLILLISLLSSTCYGCSDLFTLLMGGNDELAEVLNIGFSAATSAGLAGGLDHPVIGSAVVSAMVIKGGLDMIIKGVSDDCADRAMLEYMEENFVSKKAFEEWKAQLDDRLQEIQESWVSISDEHSQRRLNRKLLYGIDTKEYLDALMERFENRLEFVAHMWQATKDRGTDGDVNKHSLKASLGRISQEILYTNVFAAALYKGVKECFELGTDRPDDYVCDEEFVLEAAYLLLKYDEDLLLWESKFVEYWNILEEWAHEPRHYVHYSGYYLDFGSAGTYTRYHANHCSIHRNSPQGPSHERKWSKDVRYGKYWCGYVDTIMDNGAAHYGMYSQWGETVTMKLCEALGGTGSEPPSGWSHYICNYDGNQWPKWDIADSRGWNYSEDLWKLYMKTFAIFEPKQGVDFESYKRDAVYHEYQDSSWDKVKELKYSWVDDIYYLKACELCHKAGYDSPECENRCEDHMDWVNPTWKQVRTLEWTRDSTNEQWNSLWDWRTTAGPNYGRRTLEEETEDDTLPPIGMTKGFRHPRHVRKSSRSADERKRPSVVHLATEFIEDEYPSIAEENSVDSDIADSQADTDDAEIEASEASEEEDDSAETEAIGILRSESGSGTRRILEAFRRQRV